MKKHYNRIFNCVFFDDQETKKAAFAIVKKVKSEAVVVEKAAKQVVIEAIKFEICVKNIEFFDSTMQADL